MFSASPIVLRMTSHPEVETDGLGGAGREDSLRDQSCQLTVLIRHLILCADLLRTDLV